MDDKIQLVVRADRSLKPPNPITVPEKDNKEYAEKLKEHNDYEAALPTYEVESMVCDSGIVVNGKILLFTPGKKFNVRIIEGNRVQII